MPDDSPESAYVDANVFLNPILYDREENADASRAWSFLVKVIRGEIRAVTSLLTWDELVWVVRKTMGPEIALEKGADFLRFPNLHLEPVSEGVVLEAQSLLGKYRGQGLGPRDAIHAATAILKGATTVVTFDKDFEGVEELDSRAP
ncbi:MAG: type II toxin-antitoxin system VapC family toxin [Promethearchaeota archaeon]